MFCWKIILLSHILGYIQNQEIENAFLLLFFIIIELQIIVGLMEENF